MQCLILYLSSEINSIKNLNDWKDLTKRSCLKESTFASFHSVSTIDHGNLDFK